MKFNKYTRFNQPYWFSGIYKISQYTWFQGHDCEPYYHIYKAVNSGKQWGNFVGGNSTQMDKKLTFDECVKLAESHAKTYAPTKHELKNAEIAMKSWIGMDKDLNGG